MPLQTMDDHSRAEIHLQLLEDHTSGAAACPKKAVTSREAHCGADFLAEDLWPHGEKSLSLEQVCWHACDPMGTLTGAVSGRPSPMGGEHRNMFHARTWKECEESSHQGERSRRIDVVN